MEFSETSKKALKIIKKHKGGIIISELAKSLGVAKSNFGSRHLKPLEEAGLIKRFKFGKDFMVKKIKKAKIKEVIEEKPVEPKKPKIPKIKAKIPKIPTIKEIKEAKKGVVTAKYEKWKLKQEFQKIPLGWFQNRPIETKQYLRYLINISMSGAQRKKINSVYGGANNFRAIIDTLIDFL